MSRLNRRTLLGSLVAAAGFVKATPKNGLSAFPSEPSWKRGFPLYEPECYLSPPEFLEQYYQPIISVEELGCDPLGLLEFVQRGDGTLGVTGVLPKGGKITTCA